MSRRYEMVYAGLDNGRNAPAYPRWMYKDGAEPLLIHNTAGAEKAIADGYDSITSGAMANRYLINWFWDFEDMSAKQLRVFAKDEYGVELPEDADQETLFKAVVDLTRAASQNRNRLVLMAHSVRMNYDATLDEIRRLQTAADGVECETITMEFEA